MNAFPHTLRGSEVDATVAAYLPPASEALFFNGEPVAHIVAMQERERLSRIDRQGRAAVRNAVPAKLAFWDRGDGYHANDPDAPEPFRCDSCDAVRHSEREFCADCNAVTGSYVGGHFATLARYVTDPAFRARRDAETQHCRDAVNAQFDAIRDADLVRLGYK